MGTKYQKRYRPHHSHCVTICKRYVSQFFNPQHFWQGRNTFKGAIKVFVEEYSTKSSREYVENLIALFHFNFFNREQAESFGKWIKKVEISRFVEDFDKSWNKPYIDFESNL